MDVPADFANVDGIFEDRLDCGAAPTRRTARRGNAHLVKAQGQRISADLFHLAALALLAGGVEPEDETDNISLGLDRAQRPALIIRHPDFLVAVWGYAGNPFPLFGRGKATALQAAVYGFVLAPGHKQAELKILLVVLVVWVIDLERGNNFGAGILERLRHNSLVYRIATGKTLHLDDENASPAALLDLLEDVLNNRPGGNRFAGDDFPVDLGNIELVPPGDFKQELFVPGQRFALTVSLGLDVNAGFAQVNAVFFRAGKRRVVSHRVITSKGNAPHLEGRKST